MQFHPDKNGDCLEAADKFRQITEAYEVLGNFRLRKLYDKGMLHTAGENYHKVNESPEEDDATTRFYKARMKNTTGKGATGGSGRTPIYDFDEWTNSHYGDEVSSRSQETTRPRIVLTISLFQLKRQQKLKHQAAYKKERIVTVKSQMKAELVMLIFLMMLMGLCAMTGKSLDVDVVTEKKKPLVHQK